MLLIDEFSAKVRKDAYGGSAELVDDAILCFSDELKAEFKTGLEVTDRIEYCVDRTLDVCNAILPLINMLNMCMGAAEDIKAQNMDAKTAVSYATELLQKRHDEQSGYLAHIGSIGEKMVADGAKVSTFSTSGSVMCIFQELARVGKKVTVTCHEARPHNEGYRTFREISELGYPVTIGTDAALTDLTPKSDIFFIGADAITSTGHVYAKMGSYLAALACKEFHVPFYVAADTSKFDLLSLLGFPLKDSSRPPEEVSDMAVPAGSRIANTTFELIPPYLITGIITERGVIAPGSVAGMMNPDKMSATMVEKLTKWLLD